MKRYISWIVLVVLLLCYSSAIEARITNVRRSINVSALDMCNLSIGIEVAKNSQLLETMGADPSISYCNLLNDGRVLCNLLFTNKEKARELISTKNPSTISVFLKAALLTAPISQWYGQQELNNDDIIINAINIDASGIGKGFDPEASEIGYIVGDKVVKGQIYKIK